jgi:aminoglycoside/choline kinase family phosphotransferase
MALHMTPPAAAPAFLADHGWGGAEILPLAGDASFRRYFRIQADGRTAVLMDAPPEHEDIRPFLQVAEHLRDLGHSAPRTLAMNLQHGLLLLEDFGDRLLGPALRVDAAEERAVYADAVRLLCMIGSEGDPEWLEPYDMAVMQREVALFLDWYAPALGLTVDREGFVAAWTEALAPVAEDARQAPVLVLRDFHADNLILLPREGTARLGLLDFQDALAGHPAYDLVSLLQDARRDVAADLEVEMLALRAKLHPGVDADLFRARYEALGAQRNTKILGIFTRLWRRDGKAGYLAFQPRVWGYLQRNLAHPALAPVASWFETNIPAEARAPAWANGVPA